MKHADICVIIVVVLLLAALAIFSHSYINSSAAEMAARLPAIGAAIERGDWQEARSLFGEAQARWQEISTVWPILINHSDMRDVDISFVDMQVLLTQENRERAAWELATLGYYMQHVPKSENLSLQNIL